MADLDSIEAQIGALDAKFDALEAKLEAEHNISQICPVCGGAGVLLEYPNGSHTPSPEPEEVECWRCEGNTVVDWGVREAL